MYERVSGVWSEQAALEASNADGADFFGFSISVSGDTVAVGAPLEGSNSTGVNGAQTDSSAGSGAVYTFVRSGTSWTQEAYIKPLTWFGSTEFGTAVALEEDCLAVGEPNYVERASVLRRVGQWAYVSSATGTGGQSEFGASIAISGDVMLTGAGAQGATDIHGTIVIQPDFDAGAAYVHNLAMSSNPAGSPNDDCLSAFAISGDGLFAWTTEDSTSSGFDPGPACHPVALTNDVWFAWTATSSGNAVFELYSDDLNTTLTVLDGDDCVSSAVAACDNETGRGGEVVTVPVVAGETYLVVISGSIPGTGSGYLSINFFLPHFGLYCPQTSNSVGPGAFTHSNGNTSVAANDFYLFAFPVPPGEAGIFYYGPAQIQIPFGDGNRCVGGPLVRLNPPVIADQGHHSTRYVDMTAAPNLGVIVSGASLNFQYWYRDPLPVGSGFNLATALNHVFTP
jgi:hypothetical protein